MTDAELIQHFQDKIAANMLAAFGAKSQPRTALAYRGGQFVSLTIDDNGNVIEPPTQCPHCGPILLCPRHAAF